MQTIIDISSTANGVTTSVTASADTPAIPAPGDDVAIPNPYNLPPSGSYQQLTLTNRIFRYTVDSTGAPHLYVLLVTANPIA